MVHINVIMKCFFRMRYVAAYLLATLGGSKNPTESDIEKILGSVGIEAESDKMKAVVSELKGKDLEALIAAGKYFFGRGCGNNAVTNLMHVRDFIKHQS